MKVTGLRIWRLRVLHAYGIINTGKEASYWKSLLIGLVSPSFCFQPFMPFNKIAQVLDLNAQCLLHPFYFETLHSHRIRWYDKQEQIIQFHILYR